MCKTKECLKKTHQQKHQLSPADERFVADGFCYLNIKQLEISLKQIENQIFILHFRLIFLGWKFCRLGGASMGAKRTKLGEIGANGVKWAKCPDGFLKVFHPTLDISVALD